MNLPLLVKGLAENTLMEGLVVVVLLDIFAGTIRAIAQGKLNSSVGTIGLLKHMLIIISIATITMYAPLFGLVAVSNIFVSFYIFQYGLSIVENWEAMGLPVPDWVKDRLNNKKKEMNNLDTPTDINVFREHDEIK